MEFDYFYGPEDAEQYQFYRIPKLLITSEQFKDVSVESKLLYGLMLDRLSLQLQPEEKKLAKLTDRVINKLKGMDEEAFQQLDLYPD